jgi:hypothetical protein
MAIDEILYAGTVNSIAALIANSGFPPNAFFLAERLPPQVIADQRERQDLLRFARVSELGDTPEHINPALYTSGRVFAPDFELRWNLDQETGKTRVVYLGNKRTLPGLEPDPQLDTLSAELPRLQPRSGQYYLFGESLTSERLEQMGLEQTAGYYAELRIPRLLRYPALAGSGQQRRVRLSTWEYVDDATGDVRLYRFSNLETAE